jgi:hypothetical protein
VSIPSLDNLYIRIYSCRFTLHGFGSDHFCNDGRDVTISGTCGENVKINVVGTASDGTKALTGTFTGAVTCTKF